MESFWKSRYRNYCFLIPLFAIVLAYQIAYGCVVIWLEWHGQAVVSLPFGVGPSKDGGVINSVPDTLKKAGLQKGDLLLNVDGHRIVGQQDIYEIGDEHKPGDRVLVTVKQAKGGATQSFVVKLAVRNDYVGALDWLLTIVLLAMALFCVLTGIYAAAVLPNDRRALIVFALLFSVSQIVHSSSPGDFPRPLWFLATLIPLLGGQNLSLFLAFFALYFPGQFAWDIKRPWLKWIVLAPAFLTYCTTAVLFASLLFDLRAVHSFMHGIFAGAWEGILSAFFIIFFFVAMAYRLKTAKLPDARRRLQILLAGSTVSLLPLVGLVIYQAVGGEPTQATIIPIVLLFFLFPITLGYVIVADRAMNLRMVIRQGLRYTLARGGLRVLMGLATAGLLIALNNLVFGSMMNSATKITLSVLTAMLVVFVLRHVRQRAMVWLDLRFFRDSYNSEKLLEELSDNVRSIVDEKELLETVGKKISETLHVPQFAFLRKDDGICRPVYCLGFEAKADTAFSQESKTIETLTQSKLPPQIYFDRADNWVHTVPEIELVTLKDLHAQLLLPVGTKQNLLGLLSLGPKLSDEPYSSSDVQLLRSVAAQTGLALENSRLTKAVASEMAQRERLNREIEIAREVQERLFPQRLPEMAGVDFSGHCRPALGVGGDYYDFLQLPNGDLGVAIGDVSGKGIAAALLMASLQASLRGQVLSGQGNLARLMGNVNQLVYDATPASRYATFFYGQFERATLTFRYVNAGHNPPMILRRIADDTTHVIRLETGGPVVGLFPKAPYQEGVVALEPGDIFVGFTDGISEAMNADDEEWGEERLIPAIAAHSEKSSEAIIPELMAEADSFVAGAPQHDDMTLVVLKVAAR